MTGPEMWGGAECTINRVGDGFRDQLYLTGHHHRAGDMDLVADLGLKAYRLPVLWERVAPDHPERCDWRWSDQWLQRLRELGIRPIVGLIHHGSGPRYTSLLDESFAAGLARHARNTAERYPWVEDWTPVNEPLTTARFSALYGHWYPHACDEESFYAALVNQIEATRAAMRAIRSVNPGARLIQTDDLGRTYATAALVAQAAFDNVRRWLTWDLLGGRVTPGHPLWGRLCKAGLEDRLRALADDPCPPDIVGINHYLTSDRFLDHRLQRYPAHVHGGNGVQAFADVEAVRVTEPPPQGLRGALQEAWDRYGLPLAVTEVHNGCTREEQIRWVAEAWQTATDLCEAGVHVRAVTAWSLFGSDGWNTLLRSPGVYEPGAYDVRGGSPRPTAVARLVKALAGGEGPSPQALAPGWWRRDIRLLYPPMARPAPVDRARGAAAGGSCERPLVILGATGTLGQALARACRHRNLDFRLTGRGQLDLASPTSIAAALARYDPWAVINAAGWVRVDDAEADPAGCMAANADGAIALAEACAKRGIATVNFSSDLVFGGRHRPPYGESDVPAPLNVYGESKLRMERGVLALAGDHLVIRTAAFFSPNDAYNFAVAVETSLRRGEPFAAASDCVVCPTYVPDLCDAALDLLLDRETGIWHLSNGEALSWAEFAVRIAAACGCDPGGITAVPGRQLGWTAPRPTSSALASEKGLLLPSLDSAIARFSAQAAAAKAHVPRSAPAPVPA